MKRALTLLCAAAACLAVSASVASSAPDPFPLSKRVVQRGEFLGFSPGVRHRLTSSKQWADGNPSLTATEKSAETARLAREGLQGRFDRTTHQQ